MKKWRNYHEKWRNFRKNWRNPNQYANQINKEVITLNKIIDFISIKQQKQNEKIEKLFLKAKTAKHPNEIEKLIEEKTLAIQDHTLFLAFIAYLEERKLDPATIFQDVLQLPKYQFEQRYEMNWQSIVQLCFTFLAILKESDPKQYEEFLNWK